MRFYDWFNDKLYPLLGSADLTPYEPALEQTTQALCPLCQHPMGEHVLDTANRDVLLFCPADEVVKEADTGRLNELGMPRRRQPA